MRANRRHCFGMIISLALVGCGGVRAVPFQPKIKPMATSLQGAVKDKKANEIAKLLDLANQRKAGGHMTQEELNMVIKIDELAKAQKWEQAQKLIDEVVRLSQ